MGIKERLQPALNALQANRMRSALTAVGIVVGVAAVVTVVSLVRGLERSVLQQVERAGSQTLFVRPLMPGDIPFEEFSKVRSRDLNLADMKALQRAVPQVTQVTPLAITNTELKASGRSITVTLLMSDDTYLEVNDLRLQSGRNFVSSDLRLGNKVAVIGSRIPERLGLKGNPIGQFLQTPSLSLEIVGVVEEQGTTMISDRDSNLLIPLSAGMPLLTDQQRNQLFCSVQIEPRTSADDGADLVTEALRRIKGVRPKEHEGFRVFSPRQFASIVGSITGTIGSVAAGMVSIALLVGGIGIMNIMLVSVTERTREIGIRKAVGALRRDVLVQFMIEALALSLLGGVLGTFIGWGVSRLIGPAVNVTAVVDAGTVVLANGVAALTGLVFGIYPAWRAARLHPIEALRYE